MVYFLQMLDFFNNHLFISWYLFSAFYFWVYVMTEISDIGPIWLFKHVDGRFHILLAVALTYFFTGYVGLLGVVFLLLSSTYVLARYIVSVCTVRYKVRKFN